VISIEFPPKGEVSPWKQRVEAVLGAPLGLAAPDLSRLVIWFPAALCLGAACYFMLPVEPLAGVGWFGCLTASFLALCALFVRGRPSALFALLLTAAAITGFSLAQLRTEASAPPPMTVSERAVGVTGWIEAVERGGSRPRLLIRVRALDGAEEPPRRIRVRARLGEFAPGDAVSVRAVLSRPPGPAAPGGYDPARAAWFDGVALTGFAITDLAPAQIEPGEGFQRALAGFRWRLAERIRAKAGERTGGVAAALLTGERSGVSEADAEALRVSGLGHILAISGLHMALFAGGVYMCARFVFAAIEPFARAHDPRKPAAIIALVAATGYLILSGAAVSTQRAWVMAVVVLFGVLLDRRAFSMRSLALAALVVVTLAPESVIEAGFQMSFAAVAALIAVYEVWMKIKPERYGKPGFIERAVDSLGGLSTTSVVAGAATGAFAAFHFQRMAAYGLIANLAAMPVFTFWVMPAGAIALVLAPIGLDGPALLVMDAGLRVVLAIADWTAGLQGAGVSVIAADGRVIALYGAGFALATLGLGVVRLSGMVLAIAALVLWQLQTPPAMMISDAGVVLARFGGDTNLQATSLRRSRFDTGVFLQRAGEGGFRPERASLQCDALGCTGVTRDGLVLAMTSRHEALSEDCRRADIVVFDGRVSSWRRRRCEALLLDDMARQASGGAELWVKDGRIVRLRSALDARGQRPWSQPPAL
jgi:competence protein ComEC